MDVISRPEEANVEFATFLCSCWFGPDAGNTQALFVWKQNVLSLSC